VNTFLLEGQLLIRVQLTTTIPEAGREIDLNVVGTIRANRNLLVATFLLVSTPVTRAEQPVNNLEAVLEAIL